MTDRELWQALGYRVEKRSLGVCGEGYVLLVPDGSYGPGCGEGRGWGNEPAAWAKLPSADTWEGMGQVIEAMETKYGFKGHNGFTLTKDDKGQWYCEFSQPAWEDADADTAPRAVRLAALRALGVSEE